MSSQRVVKSSLSFVIRPRSGMSRSVPMTPPFSLRRGCPRWRFSVWCFKGTIFFAFRQRLERRPSSSMVPISGYQLRSMLGDGRMKPIVLRFRSRVFLQRSDPKFIFGIKCRTDIGRLVPSRNPTPLRTKKSAVKASFGVSGRVALLAPSLSFFRSRSSIRKEQGSRNTTVAWNTGP